MSIFILYSTVMEPLSLRFKRLSRVLIDAFLDGDLGHNDSKKSALTHLLGGNQAWMDLAYSVNTATRQSFDSSFGLELKDVTQTSFTLAEILKLEAAFAGRFKTSDGQFLSTLDDENDPDGSQGLSNVLEALETMNRQFIRTSVASRILV